MNAPYHNKALPPGTVLREWRLEEVLGVGGFGIVYRGQDVYFGETVAIKEYFPGAISDRLDGTTVAPTDSSSEEIYELGRQKFLEEAKILWNLSRPQRHPNVVSVRSLFEIHGTAYMVMDFESGISLSQMLREGKKFDEQSLMALIRPVAEGLEKAHTAGVLHRDIKPANILVNQAGRPVLIDFGSARFESGQATNTKVTFYTPPYAAIEQYVKSYPQGPWTDIYALGVVLYQCVAGEKPPEVLERLHGGVGQPLSARQWPGYGRAFTRAVDAAMGIRPSERPKTIADWLKLFDLSDDVADDEATRIMVQPSVSQSAPAASPQPPEPSQPPAALPDSKPEGKKSPVLAGVALGLILLMGGSAAWILLGESRVAPVAVTMPQETARPPLNTLLGQKIDAVIDAAGNAGRPQVEIARLTEAKAKISTLAASLKGDGKAPDDGPILQQLNDTARELFQNQVASIGRAQRRLLRNVVTTVDPKAAPEAVKAMTALQEARTSLDESLKLDVTNLEAVQTLDGLQKAMVDFGALQDAYRGTLGLQMAAKQKEFATLYATLQSLSGQVIALANVPEPWLLASSARKNAYRQRQENAAQAKTLAAQMSDLSAAVGASKDIKQLDDALGQAATAKTSLDRLYESSSRAQL